MLPMLKLHIKLGNFSMRKTNLPTILDSSDYLEIQDGKMLALGNPKSLEWLEAPENRSFRFLCGGAGEQSFTARKETSKRGQGDYWYGYRKIQGKLHKRYIGKSEDITRLRLQEIAIALETPVSKESNSISYINNYVTNDSKPALPSYINGYVTESQLEDCKQHCEALEAELEQARQERDRFRQELTAYQASQPQQPDYEAIRDRVLASLKLGKQAPGYKSAKKVLDDFISRLKA